MKTNCLPVLVFVLFFNQLQATTTTTIFNSAQPSENQITILQRSEPNDIRVVVSQKRIWLIADEMPMKCLKSIVKDSNGKVVLEKCFTSKCTEWFLNIESLPKGEYTLQLGENQIEKFKR